MGFMSDKQLCPICHNRYGNLIHHLQRNRACKAAMERRIPPVLLKPGTPGDFLEAEHDG